MGEKERRVRSKGSKRGESWRGMKEIGSQASTSPVTLCGNNFSGIIVLRL